MGILERLLGKHEGSLKGLFLPWHLPDLIHPQRAYLIISRVRFIAIIFAILTPLWIVIDAQLLPRSIGVSLAIGRIATALAFAGLFLAHRKSDKVKDAYAGTVLLFLIPTLFYFYSHDVLFGLKTEQIGLASSLIAGYMYLPFILVVGLAFFPLSALEGVVFVTPAFLIMAFTGLMGTTAEEFWDQLGMLWLMAMIAAASIMSGMSQLHFLSEIIIKSAHDPLTQALNRASGAEILEKYFLMAKRNETPLTIMFMDLDHFKAINDNHGHESGDKVLKAAVSRLSEVLRKEDLLIRWGGEEFLIAFPNTDGLAEDARDRLLERISKAGLGNQPSGQLVTASIGIAEVLKDDITTLDALLELADKRMYKAKKSGRDRACFGDEKANITQGGFFNNVTE